MLHASQISLSFGSKRVLDQVTLTVPIGKVTCIIGPNGAGKSSLLKVLAGEPLAHSGEVSLGGKALRHYARHELAQQRAVISQHLALAFGFRVAEVVQMGRLPYRGRATLAHEVQALACAMREANVQHLADRNYLTLSGGEKQRVQFARALAQLWTPIYSQPAPSYLLMDEPTANLDLFHQHHLLQMARALTQKQVGVGVVLHDLNLAARYADHIVMLHDGRVVASGSPAQVLQPAVIQQVYGVRVEVLPHPDHHHLVVV